VTAISVTVLIFLAILATLIFLYFHQKQKQEHQWRLLQEQKPSTEFVSQLQTTNSDLLTTKQGLETQIHAVEDRVGKIEAQLLAARNAKPRRV
jgi:uncharacterized protein HemX